MNISKSILKHVNSSSNWKCFFVLIFCSCQNIDDCFQPSGNISQKTVLVPDFSKILINRDIQLIINSGENNNVLVETGENLISSIEVKVVDDQLILSNSSSCNFVRDYDAVKIYVTTPTALEEIRSSSQYDVVSTGVIHTNKLRLVSEDFWNKAYFAVGDFRININANHLSIISNQLSSFYFTGKVNTLNVQFASGDGKFDGANFEANDVHIFHRGSNDITINPKKSLSGKITSTGNVFCLTKPTKIDVQELYTGRLIFISR